MKVDDICVHEWYEKEKNQIITEFCAVNGMRPSSFSFVRQQTVDTYV